MAPLGSSGPKENEEAKLARTQVLRDKWLLGEKCHGRSCWTKWWWMTTRGTAGIYWLEILMGPHDMETRSGFSGAQTGQGYRKPWPMALLPWHDVVPTVVLYNWRNSMLGRDLHVPIWVTCLLRIPGFRVS